MFNRFLKPYLPRSFFGRAVAILIVPIVLIQVVVAVVLVERLFQDVTRQMTQSAAIDINHVLSALPDEEHAAQRARELQISLTRRVATPGSDQWRDWINFSGTPVMQTFRSTIPNVKTVDLGTFRSSVILTIERDGELWDVGLSRRRVAAANPHQVLVYMVFSSLILVIIAALFMRNQVRPIRRLARAAEAFGKGQTVDLYPSGAQEVRSATSAFLAMRARIDRQIEQRTTMLSGVSHDLRTPLTRLRLSLSLMGEDEDANMMHRDLDDMESILDEFLAFARGDAGETAEPVAIKTLAKTLVKDARRGGQNVNLSFEGQASENPKVNLRPMAIRRALTNLLSNARKYGEEAHLTVYLGTGFVEFSVEDDGPGIARESRDEAIRPFARLDAARNQDQGSGVGLGLAITADIARSHGGSLSLGQSRSMGGLRASLRLPR